MAPTLVHDAGDCVSMRRMGPAPLERLVVSMTSDLDLATQTLDRLIGFNSVSHHSNQPITDWLDHRLRELGFTTEPLRYRDRKGVEKANLVACRAPADPASDATEGGFAYLCHTDVVPADGWNGPGGDPFATVQSD